MLLFLLLLLFRLRATERERRDQREIYEDQTWTEMTSFIPALTHLLVLSYITTYVLLPVPYGLQSCLLHDNYVDKRCPGVLLDYFIFKSFQNSVFFFFFF